MLTNYHSLFLLPHHKVTYLTFRPLPFGYLQPEGVRLVCQFRLKQINPGKIQTLTPSSISIYLFERSPVNAILQRCCLWSGYAEDTNGSSSEIQRKRSPYTLRLQHRNMNESIARAHFYRGGHPVVYHFPTIQ